MLATQIADPEIRSTLQANSNCHIHFSQFGEDSVLWELLHLHQRIEGEFFVDVGAHNPVYASNTYLFRATKGWRGINIDADDRLMESFREARPEDHNITAAVSDVEEDLVFHQFELPGINSLDRDSVERQGREYGRFPNATRTVRTRSLTSILDGLGPIPPIALLSVDVEGWDLRVLKSLDWSRYSPFAICVEDHSMDLNEPERSEIFRFLRSKNYKLTSHVWVTSIYFNPRQTGRI